MLSKIRSNNRGEAFAALVVLFFTSQSCLSPAPSTRLAAATATTSTSTVSVNADLYLKISTAYESTPTDFVDHGTCKIDHGSGLTSQTCTIRIPEGQLHYSKTKFTYGTNYPGMCTQLVFRPYFYQAEDTNAAYVPPYGSTATPINCSLAATPGCYNGAGVEIAPSFPTYTGKYFLTALSSESSDTVGSANEKFRPDNRWVANVNPAPGVAVAGDYVASTIRPYKVLCLDAYAQTVASIDVYIADNDLETGEDPSDPTNDQFYDWDEM